MNARTLVSAVLASVSLSAAERPNVLWFVVDDMSAHFSCYGETLIETPAVDRLAAEGTRFTNAHVTAPVCSAARSALITGMYQTGIGAHHHRSGRGELKIRLPENVVPIPALFQKAGYFTCIGSGLPGMDHRGLPVARDQQGKTDYNFEWDPSIYDSHDWAKRGGKPFFMQVQLHGGKLRGESLAQIRAIAKRSRQELGSATAPEKVNLPPYYPRDPVLLEDWAAYLDSVRLTDLQVGRVMERLETEGLLDNTLVIFMTDHGISHARGKQFLYDEGTHIPFIIRGPGVPKGAERHDLIEHIDMAAISLAAAGIPIPDGMQGRDILAKDYLPRDAAFSARDRCDETVDRIRSVRGDRFLYIRNFHPARPLLQPCVYKDNKAILKAMRAAREAGTLPPLSEKLLFSPTRPAEELYEYKQDRCQLTNLADAPEHQATLDTLRARLDRWIIETKDQGPESMEMFDSDMAVFLKATYPGLKDNIALMKRWAAEGK
jgi:arylsulfatase A-like enzyme